MKVSSNEIEAANRGEATSLLIRSGYRVYWAEADVNGEDLVLKDPVGHLLPVQLKGRPVVEAARYRARGLWMLFPDPFGAIRATVVPDRALCLIRLDEGASWQGSKMGRDPGLIQASRRRSAST